MSEKTIIYFWRSLKFRVLVRYVFYAIWFHRVRYRKMPLSLICKDLILMAWLCEKMKTNIKFSFSEKAKDIASCFEKSINTKDFRRDYPIVCRIKTGAIRHHIKHAVVHLIPREFCHKALLKIPIKSDFRASIGMD